MTSTNICKTRHFKNFQGFNAQCDCGSDYHQHELILEYDPEFRTTSLSLYFKTWTTNPYRYQPGIVGWFQDQYRNIKMRLKVLFSGYTEMNYDFIFGGEAAIQDYINALQEALDEQKKVNKDRLEGKNHDISASLNSGD